MRIILLLIFQSILISLMAQDKSDVWFHPNKGQWDERVLYKVELSQGAMLIEKDGFTFDFHNASDLYHHGHNHDGQDSEHTHEHDEIQHHTIKTKFKNSSFSGKVTALDTSHFYRNYFIGNDSTKWASSVYAYQHLLLHDLYPGIDLELIANSDNIKYSFILQAGINPAQIEMYIDGADSLFFEDEELNYVTRFGNIKESGLEAWNESENGKKKQVDVAFSLENKTLSYQLEKYDNSQKLVIDPQLTFSTFTGATSDNWGFTAAPDIDGNAFGAGIVFGSGYPTTSGAYNSTYNGGESSGFDIGISKFNANGNILMYSTYIGGSRNETPNSIVANQNGDLYVLGLTSSTNFPVTAGAFQSNFMGGPLTVQNGLQFTGTDLVIFKLSANGSNLLRSTYLGGTDNDGLNLGTLHYNYGDQFRGEIILDDNEFVYVASSSRSINFPTNNAIQSNLLGDQDAVLFKMNDNLTNLIFSTYFGGPGLETGNALQVSSDGHLLLTGGTTSNNWSINAPGNQNNYQGGISDGYIARFNANTGALVNHTYVGTNQYDQNYFVQLDIDDNVYVFGQSNGNIPISPNIYSVANSGQFIQKYSSNLQNILWSTRIGGGNNTIEISPTAFLVSDCYEIYFAGWGGSTNHTSQATQSTTNGFPTTPNAFQTNTSGNNFYVAVLSENAMNLNYASFIGGVTNSANHVDGGTSRFDKKGRIFHAVCASCGGSNNGFTSTPGSYAPNASGPNCNMAVFKFDLGIIESAVSISEPFICIPDPVVFQNNSQNADVFFWDFGDGNTSNVANPSHNYLSPGIYEVMLVASDATGCYEEDTSFVTIEVGMYEGSVVQPNGAICPGETFQLEADGGVNFQWSPGNVLDDSTSATPIATVYQTTTFTVIISDTCGTDTLEVVLEVLGEDIEVSEDLQICIGDTVELTAAGGVQYNWSPSTGIISASNGPTVSVSPQQTTTYTVEIITTEGCDVETTVTVEVFFDVPTPLLEDSVYVCLGDFVDVVASGGESYLWYPDIDISTTTSNQVTIQGNQSRYYFVDFTNICGTVTDSVFVDVIQVFPEAGNDTIICKGETANLWAKGGVSYAWTPAGSINNPTSSNVVVQPSVPTNYQVLVTDEYGCSATANVFVNLFPTPNVQTSPDQYPFFGDQIILEANATANGNFQWSPDSLVSCNHCPSVEVYPTQTTTYFVEFTDVNGCKAYDDVTVFLEGIIYVPNAFTPDGNDYNEYFFPVGGNIDEFHMIIFNRWGEVMWESYDFNGKWDGTYGGKYCQDGTYIWKISYTDISGNKGELVGHVVLLR